MSSSKSFLDIINEHLVSDKTYLPVANMTSFRIQQLASQQDFDIREVAKLIISDPALTAEVLRVANSTFFRGIGEVTTIRDAIVRLGINEVANIVLLQTQRQFYSSKVPVIISMMQVLWKHSVGCAVGSQWIAQHGGFNRLASEAFFAGLLHDVGKLFLLKEIETIKSTGELEINLSRPVLIEVMDILHAQEGG